jgi:beta-lactam-binding protein with PASTA domain
MANVTTNFSRQISSGTVAKIADYTAIKQAPKVITQSPAAGTPVIQGMTIELHAVSLSDVPFHVLDSGAIQAVKNVPVADIQRVIEGDARLKNAVQTGVIPDADRGYVTEVLNAGLGQSGLIGGLSTDDAAKLVQSVNDFGFVDF